MAMYGYSTIVAMEGKVTFHVEHTATVSMELYGEQLNNIKNALSLIGLGDFLFVYF